MTGQQTSPFSVTQLTSDLGRCSISSESTAQSAENQARSVQESKSRREVETEAETLPLDLSIGVEFEFLLFLVHSVLAQPLRATCTSCGKEHTFQLPLGPLESKDYSDWTIDEDSSIDLNRDEATAMGSAREFYHFYQVELKSRVLQHRVALRTSFSPDASGHVHEIDRHQEICAVLNRLEESFSSPEGVSRTRARMVTNSRCGLHVHVGNGHCGFPLRTVRNVVSTYVANERAIDSLHSVDRIGGTNETLQPTSKPPGSVYMTSLSSNAYNGPWSEHMAKLTHRFRRVQQGEYFDYPRGNESMTGIKVYPETHHEQRTLRKALSGHNTADWLTVIQHAPSVPAIRQMHDPNGHMCTLNLQNLEDLDCRGTTCQKMTLEFRQHAGTLDVSEVVHWVNVLVNIVLHAHNTNDADYDLLCKQLWQSPNCHTLDFLQSVGCHQETVNFYQHRLGMRTSGDHYAKDLLWREMGRFFSFPVDDGLRDLMLLIIQKRYNNNAPTAVNHCINQKFMIGGYGQFSTEFLDEVDFDGAEAGLREKLTIGWINECDESLSDKERSRSELINRIAGAHIRQNFDIIPKGAYRIENREIPPLVLRANSDSTSLSHQDRGSLLPLGSSGDAEDSSPVSDSSVESGVFGCQMDEEQSLLNVQKTERITSQLVSSRHSVDDHFQLGQDWTPPPGTDGSAVHPTREALLEGKSEAGMASSSRHSRLMSALGLQINVSAARVHGEHEFSHSDVDNPRLSAEPIDPLTDVLTLPRVKRATRRMMIH